MPRTTSMTAAAFAALAACALAAPLAAQVVTSAGGEVVSPAQKNLVDRLITTDSIQAATAKLAADKATNPAVKEFATQLATDHAAHASALQKLSEKKEVGRETNPSDQSGADLAKQYETLQGMPAGTEFDRAFLQSVVANHQSEISAINAGKAAAKDEDLKKDLDETSSALQAHASKATELASSLDKAPPMTPAAKPPMGGKPPVL